MTASSIAARPPQDRSRALGIGLVFTATMAWSLSGVFTRSLSTDISTAIAWRSFFGGLFLAIPCWVFDRSLGGLFAFRPTRPAIVFVLAQVVCQAATVGGLVYTTVANVTVIYATAPFLASALAWWMIGERVALRTILAGGTCLAGTAIIMMGSVGHGHLVGDAIAVVMTASFALVIVMPRAYPDLPIIPSTILAAFVTTIFFAPFGSASSLDAWNWSVLAAFGLTNFSVAFFMFVAGARHIRSAEAALIGVLEIVFAPLWVWLLYDEALGWPALAGGAMVLVAVVWHTALDWKRRA